MPSCWLRGELCTMPSRTIPIALHPVGGWQLGTSALVSNAFFVRLNHWVPPVRVKLSCTSHSLVCVLTVASALLISLPETPAGASRNFCVASLLQDTMSSVGPSRPAGGRVFVEQSYVKNVCCPEATSLPMLPGTG